MARGPRLSLDQIEEMMIPKLVEAVYPVLIPIEQQDCAIQTANRARMTEIARLIWREWATAIPKSQSRLLTDNRNTGGCNGVAID
jgi:hypothetical protein